MPLGLDQRVGALVWSPLGWGRLTGKVRGEPRCRPRAAFIRPADYGPPVDHELLYKTVDALDELAKETGRTVPQIALNWLLRRPTVASVIIGARNEEQLHQNLAAEGWALSPDQVARLDAASSPILPYPYWHQRQFRNATRLLYRRFRRPDFPDHNFFRTFFRLFSITCRTSQPGISTSPSYCVVATGHGGRGRKEKNNDRRSDCSHRTVRSVSSGFLITLLCATDALPFKRAGFYRFIAQSDAPPARPRDSSSNIGSYHRSHQDSPNPVLTSRNYLPFWPPSSSHWLRFVILEPRACGIGFFACSWDRRSHCGTESSRVLRMAATLLWVRFVNPIGQSRVPAKLGSFFQKPRSSRILASFCVASKT